MNKFVNSKLSDLAVDLFRKKNRKGVCVIMDNLIKKTILTGLGVISLTREKAEKLVKDLVKEGEVSKGEGSKLVKDLLEKAETNKKAIEKQVENTVKNVLKKLSIPSRKEVIDLDNKIEKLDKKLDKK